MCRKFHGEAFATFAGVSRSHFRWVEGEHALKGYTAENGTTRTFCSHCGSSLMFASPRASADIVEIALGAFDDDVPVKPDAHMFVGSGANWAVLCYGLPRYVEGRDSTEETRSKAVKYRMFCIRCDNDCALHELKFLMANSHPPHIIQRAMHPPD